MKTCRDILIKCALVLALACCNFSATLAFAAPWDKGTRMTDLNRTAIIKEIATPENLPETYSLTNLDQVTPVKLQNPWGDCWAFAVASALESSILKKIAANAEEALKAEAAEGNNEAPKTSETTPSLNGGEAAQGNNEVPKTSETTPSLNGGGPAKLLQLNATIDLSERALAWFVHEPQNENSAGKQAGEGFTLTNPGDTFNQLSQGNFKMIATQLVAGQTLLNEEMAPYEYNDYDANPKWYSVGSYNGARNDARTKDWSLPAELLGNTDAGWSVTDVFRLTPPTNTKVDELTGETTYESYNPQGTKEIKQALLDIGAVAIALDSETSIPDEIVRGNFETAESSEYFSYKNWAQYNSKDIVEYNHAVTIVGWDDNYPAENFTGTSSGQPKGNGAWLCKNNWGSDALFDSLDSSQDASHWGLRADSNTGTEVSADANNAEASGFFWISYYDHSLADPTAFAVTENDKFYANRYQYDYIGSAEYTHPSTYTDEVWVGNVFTSKSSELLRAVGVETFVPGENVAVKIYSVPAADTPTVADLSRMKLLAETKATYFSAGFHMLALDRAIMLNPGEKFFVATKTITFYNGKTESYLNLEISFNDDTDRYIKGNAISNLGETFVSLSPDKWIAVDENDSDFKKEIMLKGGLGIKFGNALVKAYSGPTTMSQRKQIYETARLSIMRMS